MENEMEHRRMSPVCRGSIQPIQNSFETQMWHETGFIFSGSEGRGAHGVTDTKR